MSGSPAIGTDTVSQHHGLPCRGGCALVFHPADSSTRSALLTAIGERVVHEEVVHHYVHVPTVQPKFKYGVKTGQAARGVHA